MRNPSADALFVVNQVVNFVFVVDLVLNFFLPFREDISKGGRTVREHARIARHYLRGWFFIDLVSVLPFDWLDVLGISERVTNSGGDPTFIKLIRLLRLLKLLKLARLQRVAADEAVRDARRHDVHRQGGLFYVVVIVVTLHWLACLWACLSTFSLFDRRSAELAAAVAARMDFDAACDGCVAYDAVPPPDDCLADCLTPCEIAELSALSGESEALLYNRQPWSCRATVDGMIMAQWDAHPFEIWLFCIVVAIGQLSGGTVVVTPQNPAEYVVFFLALLIGSVVWAIVQGVICGIICTGDPHVIEHRQNMDQLNFLMGDMAIPQEVRMRVREYFASTANLGKRKSYVANLELLSPMLMTDLSSHMAQYVYRSVPWLQGASPTARRLPADGARGLRRQGAARRRPATHPQPRCHRARRQDPDAVVRPRPHHGRHPDHRARAARHGAGARAHVRRGDHARPRDARRADGPLSEVGGRAAAVRDEGGPHQDDRPDRPRGDQEARGGAPRQPERRGAAARGWRRR